jgi:hypothetical protein
MGILKKLSQKRHRKIGDIGTNKPIDLQYKDIKINQNLIRYLRLSNGIYLLK